MGDNKTSLIPIIKKEKKELLNKGIEMGRLNIQHRTSNVEHRIMMSLSAVVATMAESARSAI